MSTLRIADTNIEPGETTTVRLPVARLPTGTLIDLPVHVARSTEPGPSLLIQGGLHGDEINGIEICRRLTGEGLAHPDRGTVIIINVLNIFGFLNASRDVPDGKDVNRSFPGSAKGSLASRVAWSHGKHVLPHVQAAIDLHTGGASRHNHPQARYTESQEGSRELAEAFNAPMCMASGLISKSFRKEATKRGITAIVYEAGESMRIDEDSVSLGIDGVRRVMGHLDMLDDVPEPIESIHIGRSTWLRAGTAGMFSATVRAGEAVKKGQRLGAVTDPFNSFLAELRAPADGWVMCLNHDPVVHRGDALLRVGMPS